MRSTYYISTNRLNKFRARCSYGRFQSHQNVKSAERSTNFTKSKNFTLRSSYIIALDAYIFIRIVLATILKGIGINLSGSEKKKKKEKSILSNESSLEIVHVPRKNRRKRTRTLIHHILSKNIFPAANTESLLEFVINGRNTSSDIE